MSLHQCRIQTLRKAGGGEGGGGRGARLSRSLDKGGGGLPKKFWSKNKGGRAPSLDPPLMHQSNSNNSGPVLLFKTIFRYRNDPCTPDPCKNHGSCQVLRLNSYYCACPEGWTGAHCEEGNRE